MIGLAGSGSTSRTQIGDGVGPGARRPTARSCSRRSTDPEVPPLPPHITLEQADALRPGAAQGRPDSARDHRESFKQRSRSSSPADDAQPREATDVDRRVDRRRRLHGTDRRARVGRHVEWDATTIVVVEAHAGGQTGSATPTRTLRRGLVRDEAGAGASWAATRCRHRELAGDGARVRNLGRPGLGDGGRRGRRRPLGPEGAPARLPLATLLGRRTRRCRSTAAAASPPTRTSSSQRSSSGWAEQGIAAREDEGRPRPGRDPRGSARAREAIGDGGGALRRRQRRTTAASRRCASREPFAERVGVSWFEEPVSSDDLDGLRLLRDRAPAGWRSPPASTATSSRISSGCSPREPSTAAGRRHPLRRDHRLPARRRALRGALASALAHGGPSIHAQPARCRAKLRHLEYFHDHVRIERMLFDGVLEPRAESCGPTLAPRNGARAEARRGGAYEV